MDIMAFTDGAKILIITIPNNSNNNNNMFSFFQGFGIEQNRPH